LPELENAANDDDLKNAISDQLNTTQYQVVRLEEAFKRLNVDAGETVCGGAKGLFEECRYIATLETSAAVKDAALVAELQRLKHYEIAAYGALRTYAGILGYDVVKQLMQQTLSEEDSIDKRLVKLAKGSFMHAGLDQKAA